MSIKPGQDQRLFKDLLEIPKIKNEIRKNINTPPPDDNLLLLAIRRGHQIIVAILLEMKDAIENESTRLWTLLVAQLMLKMTPKHEKSRYQSIMDRLEESLKSPQKALLPYYDKEGAAVDMQHTEGEIRNQAQRKSPICRR